MTNQQALCDSASALLASIQLGQPLASAHVHTIQALCASYVNMCESTTLAVQRADNAQKLLAQERKQLRECRLELEASNRTRDNWHAAYDIAMDRSAAHSLEIERLALELSRTQAAYHALLSGAA